MLSNSASVKSCVTAARADLAAADADSGAAAPLAFQSAE
jgi:hypothetical protein